MADSCRERASFTPTLRTSSATKGTLRLSEDVRSPQLHPTLLSDSAQLAADRLMLLPVLGPKLVGLALSKEEAYPGSGPGS